VSHAEVMRDRLSLCERLWSLITGDHAGKSGLKSIDTVRAKPEEAILYRERKPEIVKSITSFSYIIKSL
jgi:hypothetical protein